MRQARYGQANTVQANTLRAETVRAETVRAETQHAQTSGRRPETRRGRLLRRLAVTLAGGVLCLAGIALLVLPGPGLQLVLGGLVLLANEYPWARRLTVPVGKRAMRAAAQSVSTLPRIAGSVLCGAALLAAGVVWIIVPWLPFSGIATGLTLILSGILLLALLIYSYRHLHHATTRAADDQPHHRIHRR